MKCPACNRPTREPEDEQGTHPCSHCGWDPTLRRRALDAAEEIAAALKSGSGEDAAGAVEAGLPVLQAFLDQECRNERR